MLKISVIESPRRCRLVLEGTLVEPWVAELLREYTKAKEDLGGRELVVDLTNLTEITAKGEDALLQLMKDGAKFQCGIFAKEIIKQLASKRRPQ